MIIEKEYADYAVEKTIRLLAIDSPTGFTDKAAQWVKNEFEALGYSALMTQKGGVVVSLGGKDVENGLLLQGHIDTIGGMVAAITGTGRLKLTPLGGLKANNCEAENVRIHTRSGKVYEGTLQLHNPSVHVNGDYSTAARNFDTTEIVIDEDVKSSQDVKELGICNGDIVAFEPRTRVTASGYIKSRFLDDKLCVGILLAYAKYLRDNGITPKRAVYIHITVYEEVGHGGSGSVPAGITEAVCLDMGCVGDGLDCTEKMVSICAKDVRGPYSYSVVSKLIDSAEKEGADYAVDVYPYYSSDVDTTLSAGNDIRHGLIGPGVFASHGYERSHIEGVWNTLKVLKGYIE